MVVELICSWSCLYCSYNYFFVLYNEKILILTGIIFLYLAKIKIRYLVFFIMYLRRFSSNSVVKWVVQKNYSKNQGVYHTWKTWKTWKNQGFFFYPGNPGNIREYCSEFWNFLKSNFYHKINNNDKKRNGHAECMKIHLSMRLRLIPSHGALKAHGGKFLFLYIYTIYRYTKIMLGLSTICAVYRIQCTG